MSEATSKSVWIERAVLVVLTAAGLFCPWGVLVWYAALLTTFVLVAIPVLSGALFVTWLGERSNDRLQGPRARPGFFLEGLKETTSTIWVAACFVAWAVSRWMKGLPIGLTWDASEMGGPWWAALQTLAGVLVIDAWLYWKHRILHTRWLFAFHKAHHRYRDPSALSSFAIGPVEALVTFWPVVFVALPEAKHWAPMYFSLVVGFVLLNLYLHCGVKIPLLERVLPSFMVNTSVFHNKHHANAEVNYGEALTLWDFLCLTGH